ncbi:MAG: putative lipopolysaccharide heptosyltransferase III [Chthoniobacterales bacterium]
MVFQKKNPASVLIIKLRHHGDVLLATPVARTLKASFPTCHIDFLVYEGTEALLKNNPDLRQVWLWPRVARGWNLLRKILQLFFQLRAQRYDLVIHLSDQMQGAFLAKLLAPRQAIGIDYPKRRHWFWRACFSHLAPLFPSNTHHTVEQNLATLQNWAQASNIDKITLPDGIGLQSFCQYSMPDPNLHHCSRLVVSNEDRDFIHQQLQQKKITTPYLLIHPTARWFFKCWEENRFAEVMNYFATQGWPILVTSGPEPEEQAMVSKIIEQTRSPHVYSLAGQLTLGQLAAAIEKAHLFIGVDSVPMHMAAALQKKVVALFGPSKINEWHPWKTDYCLIKASDYGPLIDPDAVKTETTERYLSNIPVEAVIAAMEEILTEIEGMKGMTEKVKMEK